MTPHLAPADETSPTDVTSVIRHTVRQTEQDQYEAWLREIVPLALRFEGHRGVNVIRPHAGSRTYTIVLHYDTLGHLEHWLASDQRNRLVRKVQHLLEAGDQVEIKTGLEFWFTPPAAEQKRAKAYKQFLLTLSVIFPLTVIIPWLLRPLLQAASTSAVPGLSTFVVAALIVGLMTYVIMPRYTRLLAFWLYR
ncbi:MAG: antibiotic biosynthesis monooxygenase [Acetobacteraceae bacterium]|nr:antibiotic biosynthesis monooxygenase [Acetobacteraceae bacterium]